MSEKTKYCQNCGEEIDAEAEICPECGVRVKKAVAEEENNTKDKGITVILALVAGIIGFWGVGYFYLEKFGRGVAFLLCGWVAAFIGSVGMALGALAFGPSGFVLGFLGIIPWLAGCSRLTMPISWQRSITRTSKSTEKPVVIEGLILWRKRKPSTVRTAERR